MIKIKTENHEFGFDMSLLEGLLFLTVGMAMAQIQGFEGLVAAILCTLVPQESEETTFEDFENILDDFGSKTLGCLINLIKDKVYVNELHDKLRIAKVGRNFIVHHALQNTQDLNEDETIRLVKEIEDIMADIEDAQNLLIAELSAQNVTHISEGYINLETGEIEDTKDN
jgi:hypothetical protein